MPGSLQAGSLGYALWEAPVPVVGVPRAGVACGVSVDPDSAPPICTSPHVTPTVPPGSLGWRSWSQTVVGTGDSLCRFRNPVSCGRVASPPHAARSLRLGSNDVFGAKPINPTRTSAGPSQLPKKTRRTVLDTMRLVRCWRRGMA